MGGVRGDDRGQVHRRLLLRPNDGIGRERSSQSILNADCSERQIAEEHDCCGWGQALDPAHHHLELPLSKNERRFGRRDVGWNCSTYKRTDSGLMSGDDA